MPTSILHHFRDGPSSPELNPPSSLHGLGVADTRVLLSELFKDDEEFELENSESDEESDSEDSSCRAALSRESNSFLEGLETWLIAVDGSNHTMFGYVILRCKYQICSC